MSQSRRQKESGGSSSPCLFSHRRAAFSLHSPPSSPPPLSSMMDPHADSPPESLFRSVKKRKFLRRRADPDAEDPQLEAPAASDHTAPTPQPSDTENTTLSADASRVRRPHRARRGGIEFSASSRQVGNEHQPAAEPPAEELEGDRIRAMCDRFTGYTGQSVDVDKHMYVVPRAAYCPACM